MKGIKAFLLFALLCTPCFSADEMFFRVVSTQPSRIISFTPDGILVWSNSYPGARCRIESIPVLSEEPTTNTLSADFLCEDTTMSVRMPMQTVETPIILSIYSNESGDHLETWALQEDQPFAIQIEEDNPQSDPQHFDAYACQEDCYTKLYYVTNSQTVSVDLESTPQTPRSMTGVIFVKKPLSPDCYYSNQTIHVTGPSGPLPDIATDEYGRYSINFLTIGSYTLGFSFQGQEAPFEFQLSNSEGEDYKDIHLYEPDPVGSPIVFSIYSDGWGTLLETRTLPENHSIKILIEEDRPYFDPPSFYAYASQEDSYTQLYSLTNGQTVAVDLEPVPQTPFSMTGVVFAKQSYFRDCYLRNQTLHVTGPSGPLQDIATDEYGRYSIINNETGTYTLDFSYQEFPFSVAITNSEGADYEDLSFYEPYQAAAPNIYLYPETETNVTVVLGFPSGEMTVSDPPYNNGWNVSVDPDGTIDGQHGYLFYEGAIPQRLESKEGWLLDGTRLEAEFRALMAELGFQGREIDDFMAYWMPLMEGSPWYAVYPQDPEMVTTLHISPAPQNVLRYHFVVRALSRPIAIPEPTITPFTRNGFTVVEWGVSGWEP